MAGVRFDDEDMVNILKKKMEGKGSNAGHFSRGNHSVISLFLLFFKKMMMEGMASAACQFIPEIKIHNNEPWDLPGLLFPDNPYTPKAWFCFCRPDYKTGKSSSRKRVTKQGFWKSACSTKEIKSQQLTNSVTCKRRTLTFHIGRERTAVRTRWFMYEYEFIKTGPGSKTNQHTDFILCRIENKSADHQSDNKNLNDSSISDELADSGANHMILEEEQQSGYQELGHVLLGSGNHDDAELGGSAASVQSVDDVIQEPSAQPGDYVNHQPEPPQLLQLPLMGNGPDVYTHEYSNWPSPFRDNDSYLTNKNNTSTNYDNEPVNYSSYNFPSQATDEWHQPVKMNLLFKDDQPAATDMISDPVEHLPNEEPGECTESPNGFWLNHNVINDISTCDDDESFSDFDSPAANKRFQEYCAELGKTLHQPTHQPPLHQLSQEHQPQLTHQPPLSYQPSLPHQLPQSQGDCSSILQLPLYKKPGIGVNNSYPAHKNKISTNDDNEPVSDIANGLQDRATERISEVYNHSTDYRNEPVSNTAYNQHNGAIDECVSEPEDILGSLFQPFDLQDYTLMSPMIEELGDVVHCQ